MKRHLSLAMVCLALLVGCGPSPVTRTNKFSCSYGPRTCATNAREETPYALNYIDLGKDGRMTDPKQLGWAQDHIRAAATAHPEHNLVIVFVHGWFHSDDPQDRDVNRARDTLDWLARRHPDWHVEGVYVGWQAYTDLPPLIQFVTFWDKARNADALGDPTHGDLIKIVERMQQSVELGRDNKLIFIGHSFGGRALYRATEGLLREQLKDSLAAWESLTDPAAQQPVRGVGSLVLLIEPAMNADAFAPLFSASNEAYAQTVDDKLRHRDPLFMRNDRPLFLAVTSSEDMPVKIALPLSSIATAHTDGMTSVETWPPGTRAIPTDKLKREAFGHEEAMLTHHFEVNGSPSMGCNNTSSVHWGGVDVDFKPIVERQELPRGWLQCAIHEKSEHGGGLAGSKFDKLVVPSSCTQLRHLGMTSPYNPYWNASSNASFIQGHSAFMNQSLVVLLNQLVFSPPYTNDEPAKKCHSDTPYGPEGT